MTEREMEKIKALVDAVSALKEEGYTLTPTILFEESYSISKLGTNSKIRFLKFALHKRIPLEGVEEELNQLLYPHTH